MVNVLFVGGTGHIGGAILDQFLKEHPEATVKVLVRDEEKSSRLVAKYPKVQTIIGDLGTLDVLETASREADIVINTAPDITHDAGIKAIFNGLKKSGTGDAAAKPKSYYIHTSGASLIWDEPQGSPTARWWDDITDVAEICAFEGQAYTHSLTDKIVRAEAANVNVAIVSPGGVGGMSPSIEHPTPIVMPAVLLTARAFKSGWQIAQGENMFGIIHVEDLARMYLILVRDAITALGGSGSGEAPAAAPPFDLWGPEAYYFGVSENITFADYMGTLAPIMKDLGIIPSSEIKSVSVTDAARASMAGADYDPEAKPPPLDTWALHIAITYGVNMRMKASRMAALGWKPQTGPVLGSFAKVFEEYAKAEKAKSSAA
ncbi:hypothetical protein BX600DRAFT_434684 [Xylariales sp. PMI_506]|nr:hypothetical protein BX600DRAFT_434684 [Xylariales sp. PMI_506]